MHPRTSSAIDGESLQADVMRFMAIIAFCLVAIMALVRDVAPPQTAQTTEPVSISPNQPRHQAVEAAVPEVQLILDSSTVPESAPADADSKPFEVLETAVREKTPVGPKPVIEVPARPRSTPEMSRAEQLRTELAALTPMTPKRTREEAKPPQLPEPLNDQPPESASMASSDPEPGLSLRFNSDRDFLRLIGKGEVAVYLFQNQQPRQWLKLGSNYAFVGSQPPREIYELMATTIPRAIRASASAAVGDFSQWQWGVAMPGRIQSRIEELVGIAQTGQLVINRFGQVEHTPAQQTHRAEG